MVFERTCDVINLASCCSVVVYAPSSRGSCFDHSLHGRDVVNDVRALSSSDT